MQLICFTQLTFLQAAGILTDYVASRDDRAALVTRLAAPEELYRNFDQVSFLDVFEWQDNVPPPFHAFLLVASRCFSREALLRETLLAAGSIPAIGRQ